VTRPRVSLIALGGTISSTPSGRGHHVPTLSGAELVAGVPEAAELAEVVDVPGKTIGGHALTPSDFAWLAELVAKQADDRVEGVVITQGTDTIEETAYALALQLDCQIPVVVTGAMRTAGEPGADGPANILSALRVALTPETARLGPVVVIQDEIHAARFVTKAHTSRVAAFASPSSGPVGEITEGKVRISSAPWSSDFLGRPSDLDKSVEIIWAAAGSGAALVEAAYGWADGLVIAGLGGGHVPPAMLPALRAGVNSGVPTVLATRCGGGAVLTDTYDSPGTEVDLLRLGLLPAGNLAPVKARLRLMVALALGLSGERVFPVS
jgi:L-asparaginase